MVVLYFSLVFSLIGLLAFFLFRKRQIDRKDNEDLYEVFEGHPIKPPILEIQTITWLPTFTVTFFDQIEYEYAKNNGLFERFNKRVQAKYYDRGFPTELAITYRWNN